jgi:hypothetical protein
MGGIPERNHHAAARTGTRAKDVRQSTARSYDKRAICQAGFCAAAKVGGAAGQSLGMRGKAQQNGNFVGTFRQFMGCEQK